MTGEHLHYSYCEPCAKRSYPTRKAARRASKANPSEQLQPYRCPNTPDGAEPRWHLGHTSPWVRRGTLDKDVWREYLR